MSVVVAVSGAVPATGVAGAGVKDVGNTLRAGNYG